MRTEMVSLRLTNLCMIKVEMSIYCRIELKDWQGYTFPGGI